MTAATIDQCIESDSIGEEFERRILNQPEQDRNTSPRLRYRTGLGLEQQHISSEECIQIAEPSIRSTVRVPWEPRREFYSSSLKTKPPTTDEGLAPIFKNPTLQLQWSQILERFDIIARREDNWDGYESRKPNKECLDLAKQFMEGFLDTVASDGDLQVQPLISSDEDGHITVEWYAEERQLHFQIEEDEVLYIQAWGPNIDTEMHVDTLSRKDYVTLWTWLLYG